MRKKSAVAAGDRRLLNIKESAAYWGATPWFVRSLIWDKRIAYVKFGSKYLLDKKDLDAFVEQEKVRG